MRNHLYYFNTDSLQTGGFIYSFTLFKFMTVFPRNFDFIYKQLHLTMVLGLVVIGNFPVFQMKFSRNTSSVDEVRYIFPNNEKTCGSGKEERLSWFPKRKMVLFFIDHYKQKI